MQQRVVLRGQCDGHSAWGKVTQRAIFWLRKGGFHVSLRPTASVSTDPWLTEETKSCIVHQVQPEPYEILLHPPTTDPFMESEGKKIVWFSMWESSGLPADAVDSMNKCHAIIVPSRWNQSTFAAAGVKQPISVLPLGVDASLFHYKPLSDSIPFTVLVAGKVVNGGHRKGLSDSVDAFLEAFPDEPDVALKIKVSQDCEFQAPDDHRITVIRDNYQDWQIANLISDCHVFLSMSRGEGWGLWNHQAMAMGRPCICARFTAPEMYLSDENCFPVDYDLEPAEGIYEGSGQWCVPSKASAVAQLRRCAANRDLVSTRGLSATRTASQYSEVAFGKRIVELLKPYAESSKTE